MNEKQKKYLVILDLDDTLYPEKSFVNSGFKAVSRYISEKDVQDYETTLQDLVTLFERGVRRNTFNILLENIKAPPSLITLEELIQVYQTHKPTIELWQDAFHFLEFLKQNSNKYFICLISDGLPIKQYNKITVLNIRHYFQRIIITDELGGIEFRKPNTKAFEIVLEQFKINSKRAICFADNPAKDFIAPKKLGLWTVRIRKPDGIYAALEAKSQEAAAHYTITSFDQGISMLKSLKNNRSLGE